LLTQLRRQVSQGATGANANIAVGDPELSEEGAALAGNAGMPLDIDAQKPSVAAGVQCPADILQTAANPSKQLLDSLSHFSAIEHLVQEEISPQGTPGNRPTTAIQLRSFHQRARTRLDDHSGVSRLCRRRVGYAGQDYHYGAAGPGDCLPPAFPR